MENMDTRRRLITLVDYHEYYGEDKSIEDAATLIANIPSLSLINYISGFNIQLYLKDDDGKIQFNLIDSLLGCQERSIIDEYCTKVQKLGNESRMPIFFYRYSNYRFYDLIFSTFNNQECRDLTNEEKLSFFKAYLIVNSLVNNEISLNTPDFETAKTTRNFEPVIITNFMYQRDFDTNMELRNQLIRGVCLFDFLNNHSKYSVYMPDYYAVKGTKNHLQLCKTILCSATLTKFTNENPNDRVQIITIAPDFRSIINLNILDSLRFNEFVTGYKKNTGIKRLWTKPLYKISDYSYYVLDINFFINQLCKSPVFEFSSYLRIQHKDENFPSLKGKHFSEEIYLKELIARSFPYAKWYMGEDVKIKKDEELCDAYIRYGNKIALIEFKDVSIKDEPKSKKIVKDTFDELDKKFFANENGKPKGVTQLVNAIEYIKAHPIPFGSEDTNGCEIYPIVIYTDNALGMDGINYLYKEKFKEMLNEKGISSENIKDVVFINLIHWEDHEQFYRDKHIDLFDMLNQYAVHISEPKYSKTPFEIFSRFYHNHNSIPELYQLEYYDAIKDRVFKEG
jgi:hypothetical protein